MTVFTWEGKARGGKIISGEIEAPNAKAALNALRAQRITPDTSKLKEKGGGMNFEIKIPGFGPKVIMKDVVLFTRQFASLIDAGVPMMQALELLGRSHSNKAFQRVLYGVKDELENGGSLADGMAKFPKAFDDVYINMVIAGESGGTLNVALERLSSQLEKSSKLKRELKTAMIYPALVISVAVIVTMVILIFVIPTFAELFSDFGAALPLPTQVVIDLSNFVTGNIVYIIAGFGGIIGGFIKFSKTERGKEVIHPLLLKLPIFGDIIRKVAVARFSRTLGTMINSGVPILEGLSICAKTAGNKVVERDIKRAEIAISEGKSMDEPLSQSSVFMPVEVQMIAVGEATGGLDMMLSKIAIFYEEEVDTAVAGMKQMIEPIMILFLGAIIGGLVIAMYLPILKMGSIVGN